MDVVRLAQAGIAYSVATLGTATTPEHLNRLFRVCGEVVFCFDGDRAGRTAAWRALENALAHAREGRQLRFLFLPEGQDPDSLVGAEGAEAFEARIAGAMPLSEYLVGELTSQVDLSSVDGRAKLAELARPLVQRVPEGVYRELLLERLAQDVRMPAGRLAQLLGVEDGQAPAPMPRGGRRPLSAGRRPLLTQAILLVLQYPTAARAVTDLAPVAALPIKGVEVLVELLRSAQAEPDLTTARLVERWRDRPEGGRLAELAGAESLVTDAAGASRELRTAVDKLIAEHGPERRLDELIARSRDQKLTPEEQQEFQALLKQRASGGRPPDSA
jgi:DNA primase